MARTAAVIGSTGVAAGIGVLTFDPSPTGLTASPAMHRHAVERQAASLLSEHAAGGAESVSRAAPRPRLLKVQRATKSAALPGRRQNLGGAVTASVPPPSPRQMALALLPSYGWDSSQFSCLDALWVRESNWNPYAENPTSGAYGIPQSLPGSKMAASGSDWATNAGTQIRWGLWYIRQSYGSPCGAWYFWESHSWY